MMSYFWTGCLALSIVFACVSGSIPALGAAVLQGAESGVELGLSLAGGLCLWSALARVMERAGLTAGLARLLGPLLDRLYPKAGPEARAAISANFTANLLGLGNAATPPGIQAVRLLQARQNTDRAGDELCRLVVMNTASIQLIPATAGALRQSAGAASAFDILPAVWLTSLCSVSAGLLAAWVLEQVWRRRGW